MLTLEQIDNWLDYYLYRFGEALRSGGYVYAEVCWKRVMQLQELREWRVTVEIRER